MKVSVFVDMRLGMVNIIVKSYRINDVIDVDVRFKDGGWSVSKWYCLMLSVVIINIVMVVFRV